MKGSKNTFLYLLLALFVGVCFLSLPGAVRAAELEGDCGEGLHWKFDAEQGFLSIAGSGEMEDYTPGTTPWETIKE